MTWWVLSIIAMLGLFNIRKLVGYCIMSINWSKNKHMLLLSQTQRTFDGSNHISVIAKSTGAQLQMSVFELSIYQRRFQLQQLVFSSETHNWPKLWE